jgi:TonB-linked SusC/RagA family outer membrane protein
MKKLVQSLFILLFIAVNAIAQERTVTGTVTSAEDGLPLPGVSVRVKGGSAATQTNADGKYTISVPSSNSVLVFTFIGTETKEVSVGGKGIINTDLATDNKQLSEVVVTAMGINRNAKSLGYAVSQISGEEITKAREANVVNSLAGKVAGVRITSQSGTIGGSAKINIRGVSSLNSAGQPIFVIDGLPIDNGAPQVSTVSSGVPQGSAGADFGNRASDISPDDIESISVLKGAAATALYGSRAKDGAIIITTKKGKLGKASITFNSSLRSDNVLVLPDLQNEYAQGVQGIYNIASTNGWGPKISDVQDLTFPNFLGNNVTLRAYEDNVKDFFHTGRTYINSVSISGANDQSDYRFGYTSTLQNGIIPASELDRNTFNFNAGRKLGEKFDIRSSLNYTRTKADGRTVQSSNNPNVLVPIIFGLPRTVDINELRANYLNPATGQQNTLTPARNGNNPYWLVNNNNFFNTIDRVYGNVMVNFKPLKWLTISNNIGSDFYNEVRGGNTRPGTIGALTGNFFRANISSRSINNDLIATAERNLTKDLNLKVIVGHNIYETNFTREQVDAQTLTVDQLYTYTNAAATIPTLFMSKSRLMGVYGDIGLSYKDYLFLNVTGRNDWSSTLPVANRSYFYPSVSSSFVFTELLPENKILNYGKLRVSYANVGSGTTPYSLAFQYFPQSTSFAQYGYGSTFPFNGALAFSGPSTIPNSNLKPQNQGNFEVGTELRFLNSRITLDVTYYVSNTTDQIINLNVPQSTGFFARSVNAGALKNEGLEVSLGLVPVLSNDFKWNTDFNFSTNRQTVSLPSEIPNLSLQSGWSGLIVKATDGKPFEIYGRAWERDPNGNIVIDPNTGLRRTVNDKPLGKIFPDWNLGINNTFNYKKFTLGFLVDIREGGVLYSNTVSTLRSTGLAEETLVNRGNIFIDEGVILTGPNTYAPNTRPVQSMQDFWNQSSSTNTEASIFDASYVKLREIIFSYSLPGSFFKKAKFIKGVDLGLEGRNVWIIKSNVPHIDPEVNFFGPTSLGEGVEFNSVPSTRTLGFNLRLKL